MQLFGLLNLCAIALAFLAMVQAQIAIPGYPKLKPACRPADFKKKVPITKCQPSPKLKDGPCNTLIRQCRCQHGIVMKNTKGGCRPGRGSGGCQCAEYCGWWCKDKCLKDPFKRCAWVNGACKNKYHGGQGPIGQLCIVTGAPSTSPSVAPTESPSTSEESTSSSMSPSTSPSSAPSATPTTAGPTTSPSTAPTTTPSTAPSTSPSDAPTTVGPTTSPSVSPSGSPSTSPTLSPSSQPTASSPTSSPTTSPSTSPTTSPTTSPSASPTTPPTTSPTTSPSVSPSVSPSTSPSTSPITSKPSNSPSSSPITSKPSNSPSFSPITSKPSNSPSSSPITSKPSKSPSRAPTNSPTPCTVKTAWARTSKDQCTGDGSWVNGKYTRPGSGSTDVSFTLYSEPDDDCFPRGTQVGSGNLRLDRDRDENRFTLSLGSGYSLVQAKYSMATSSGSVSVNPTFMTTIAMNTDFYYSSTDVYFAFYVTVKKCN